MRLVRGMTTGRHGDRPLHAGWILSTLNSQLSTFTTLYNAIGAWHDDGPTR